MSDFNIFTKSQKVNLEKIRNIFRKYKIVRAYIFGSYIKGAFSDVSDLDFLIIPEEGMGCEFYELWDELEAVTSRSVDLVTELGINLSPDQAFTKRVLAERVCIYDRERKEF